VSGMTERPGRCNRNQHERRDGDGTEGGESGAGGTGRT
jgi:hypothetical protein